jgi:hypothetical protein
MKYWSKCLFWWSRLRLRRNLTEVLELYRTQIEATAKEIRHHKNGHDYFGVAFGKMVMICLFQDMIKNVDKGSVEAHIDMLKAWRDAPPREGISELVWNSNNITDFQEFLHTPKVGVSGADSNDI